MSAPAPSPSGVEPLAGKYRIEHVIGRGGMGIVLRAVHLRLDEPVAIKLLLQDVATEPSVVERFMREARAASKIKSPHVVRVTDIDVLPSGAPYMVMELLEGYTLAELCRAQGPLAPGLVTAYLRQACDALAEAHELGIVHRDLKPSNLFLWRRRDGTGVLKVLDFGISKLGGQLQQGEITQTDTLLGSPTYMSPEQLMSSRQVDGRSDIWSLGIVLYQCLTGTVPFKADTLPQICMKVLHDPVDPPAQRRDDLPPGLSEVVLRCLEKNPDNRFATATELSEALAPFAATGALRMADVPQRAWRGKTAPESMSETMRLVAELSASRPAASAVQPVAGGSTDGAAAPAAAAGTGSDEGQRSRTQGGWDAVSVVPPARPGRRRVLVAGAIGLGLVGCVAVALLTRSSGAPASAVSSSTPAELGARPASATASVTEIAPSTVATVPPEVTATATASAAPALASATAAPRKSADVKATRPPTTATSHPKTDPFGQSRR